MSWLKISIVLSAGVLLVAQSSTTAMSQEPPPPRDRGAGWDGGPGPEGPVPGGPGDPRRANGARRPQPPRGDEEGPPGPAGMRGGDRGDPWQPMAPGGNPRRALQFREGPGHPEGEGPQPPGPPPGYSPRGREDFESLKMKDPELYKAIREDYDLEFQSREQADQFRRAGKGEQAKIKEKLLEIVNKHFEVRQQLRSLEVKRLEQQLKQLRDKIDQRAKDRKDIVAKRMIELTGADEGERF